MFIFTLVSPARGEFSHMGILESKYDSNVSILPLIGAVVYVEDSIL